MTLEKWEGKEWLEAFTKLYVMDKTVFNPSIWEREADR